MKLEMFFEKVGGCYEEIASRLPSDAMIKKFVLKFPSDPSYQKLKTALEVQNVQEAFLAAHTLKGTAANLGLGALAEAASELTEKLRDTELMPPEELVQKVDTAYKNTTEQIGQIDVE